MADQARQAERAADQARQLEAAQRRAQQQLQQMEAAQKRIQQMQQAAAAQQQEYAQRARELEAAQRRIQAAAPPKRDSDDDDGRASNEPGKPVTPGVRRPGIRDPGSSSSARDHYQARQQAMYNRYHEMLARHGNARKPDGDKGDPPTAPSAVPAGAAAPGNINPGGAKPGGQQLSSGGRASESKKGGEESSTGAGAAARTGSAGRGSIGRHQLLPSPGTFRPGELLVTNPNAASLVRAVASGRVKVIEEIALPALGSKVMRLEAPSDPVVLEELRGALSADSFSFNLVYHPIPGPPPPQGAIQPALTPQSGAMPNGAGIGSVLVKPGAVGCARDRCFGADLIAWQPQHATCVTKALKIGVIDTGVDKSHPAFDGVDFVHMETEFLPAKSKKPPNMHGTGILSLLAGSRRSTTPGLIPDASYFVGDAFYADASGQAISDTATMLKALNWLLDERVDIANLSFAGPRDELVHAAIVKLAAAGTVVVAAAGNEGPDAPPSYPAAFKEVVAVTAVTRDLEPYRYANRGDYIAVAAPGVDVWTALPGRREGPQTGTSFAVPYVTSVIALGYPTAAQRTDGNPMAPRQRALALMGSNVKDIGGRGRDPVFGAGLVQAPNHCVPRGPTTVARADPDAGPAGAWTGTVQPASSAASLQGGAWTGTVQSEHAMPTAGSWSGTVHAASQKELRY
jgi:hypothetical protein